MMNSLTAGPGAALTLRAISKAYGATLALDNVDLAIERGEVLALMGANGAGKSTLAKIAAGVTQPDQGEIFLGQSPLRLTSPLAGHQAGIVTVHQSTELLGVASLSVAENLILGELCGGSFGLRASARRMRARAATVAAGIGLDLPLDQ
jgi:simple sugar transport system ATP-binding protein